jgi:hypothetical protein
MKNALLAVIPLGSKEMVALEVYLTDEAKRCDNGYTRVEKVGLNYGNF